MACEEKYKIFSPRVGLRCSEQFFSFPFLDTVKEVYIEMEFSSPRIFEAILST